MIAAALAWASVYRLWIYVAIAVCLVLGTVWLLDTQYDRGYVAGRAIGDAALARVALDSQRQRADDEKAYRALAEKFARLDHELARREALAASITVERVRTVKEIVNAYPEFGRVSRPDALGSVRNADLDRLRRAAAATHVPGNRFAGLPGAHSPER